MSGRLRNVGILAASLQDERAMEPSTLSGAPEQLPVHGAEQRCGGDFADGRGHAAWFLAKHTTLGPYCDSHLERVLFAR